MSNPYTRKFGGDEDDFVGDAGRLLSVNMFKMMRDGAYVSGFC